MIKEEAYDIVRFIEEHFDMVTQEEYFELCSMILDLIAHLVSALGPKAARELIEAFPDFFGTTDGE